jgi:hypothetical protein
MSALPQHLESLARANKVRHDGAELKGELRARTITLVEALEDPRAQPLPVIDVLMAYPRVGVTIARRMMLRAQICESSSVASPRTLKRVRDLTDRQRQSLRAILNQRSAT